MPRRLSTSSWTSIRSSELRSLHHHSHYESTPNNTIPEGEEGAESSVGNPWDALNEYPHEYALTQPHHASKAIERVSAWLEQYHISRTSTPPPPARSLSPDAQSVRRSTSEVSLRDFLRCSAPYRPKFLNKQNHSNRSSACVDSERTGDYVSGKRSESGSAGPQEAVQSEGAATATSLHVSDVVHGGDAEFLGYVFSGFVSFHQMDFARRADDVAAPSLEALSGVQGDLDPTEYSCVQSPRVSDDLDDQLESLWTRVSSAFYELTKEITFIQ